MGDRMTQVKFTIESDVVMRSKRNALMSPLRGVLNAATGGDGGIGGRLACTAAPTERRGWSLAPSLPQPLRGTGYGKLSGSLCACGIGKLLAGAMIYIKIK